MNSRFRSSRRAIAALFLFGVSFGYVEAAVVAYLRAIYDPMRRQIHPERQPGDLFPLISLGELKAAGPEHVRRLGMELGREAATLVMLGAVALAVSNNTRQWFAAFAVVFGIWDISFYAGLKILLNWPESFLTWDILFLLPVAWVGPVLAPILVSLSMIASGLLVFHRDLEHRLAPFRWFEWALILAGGLIVILAFTWDYRNTSAGGWPNPFNWPLFLLGEAAGLTGVASRLRVNRI